MSKINLCFLFWLDLRWDSSYMFFFLTAKPSSMCVPKLFTVFTKSEVLYFSVAFGLLSLPLDFPSGTGI